MMFNKCNLSVLGLNYTDKINVWHVIVHASVHKVCANIRLGAIKPFTGVLEKFCNVRNGLSFISSKEAYHIQ